MVPCRALLITVLLLFLPAGSSLFAAESACMACHRPHHVCEGDCVRCHGGDDRTQRKEIAHHDLVAGRFAHYRIEGSKVVGLGRELLEGLACRRCHVYADKGNRLAGSLDRTGASGKARDIHDSIRTPALFMPNFHLSDSQIASLVNAILAQERVAEPQDGETPVVVHFQDPQNIRKNIFAEKCGACHKILSEKSGGLGGGDVAPNLSGLFSTFYPHTYRDREPWNPDNLRKWLDNPRMVKPNAVMQPVPFTPREFRRLLEIIGTYKSSSRAFMSFFSESKELL